MDTETQETQTGGGDGEEKTANHVLFCETYFKKDGKESIINIFDELRFPRFPMGKDSFVVVVFCRYPEGKHKIELGFRSPEGKVITPPIGGSLPTEKITYEKRLRFTFRSLLFPKPGTYTFFLNLDEENFAERPLPVILDKGQSDVQ
ncbi:MAG: DUF6941 family protein [Planctomycetota bacterium]|jgi:hypothetical protein